MDRTFKRVLLFICLSLILFAQGIALAKELTAVPVTAEEGAALETQPVIQDIVAGDHIDSAGEVALIIIAGVLVVFLIAAVVA